MDLDWMSRTCLAHAARSTANLVTRHYNRYLAPLDLEVTQAVLLGLIGAKKANSQADLARLLGIERSTLQRNLRLLETAGLVEKKQAGGNRIRPELTKAGEERFKAAYAAWQRAQNSLSSALEDPGAEAIRDHLKALRKATHKAETP
ncbi:MarR family winged helix-turn-helix transcriptional regulator [Roseibium sp. RKSG952]|uniref:MarR family winged helix-turn-helix transcriptional regulator n=1 Tax=Roseibium sp. RKSG952 TaxID=2529384 RepID=UPI0018AD2C76|nr:MarR family transcriptional regulator [Roseibium sp. RKSG952]